MKFDRWGMELDKPLWEQMVFYPVEREAEKKQKAMEAEIERRKAEVRAGWDKRTERMRATGTTIIERYTVPMVTVEEGRSKVPNE